MTGYLLYKRHAVYCDNLAVTEPMHPALSHFDFLILGILQRRKPVMSSMDPNLSVIQLERSQAMRIIDDAVPNSVEDTKNST